MIAVLGGFGSAVAWAVANLCSSRSSRLLEPVTVVAWVMFVGLIVTGPIALAEGTPRNLGGSIGWVILAGAGNVAGLMLVYAAYRIEQVALVAPLVSTEGALAAVIAVIAGESLSGGVAAMLVVIAFGVSLAARPADATLEGARRLHLRAVALAVLASTIFGASLYAAGRAGDALPSAWVALSARLIGTVVLALPLALAGRMRLPRRAISLVLVAGICEVVGFFSYTAGARHGIAVAAVLSSQFAVLGAIGGYLLFGERLSRTQLAGIAVVIAAVTVLSALQA
jgi:drug/metabolite transporter (DMT)-like permease